MFAIRLVSKGPQVRLSTTNHAAVTKSAQRIVHAFARTRSIRPDGAKLGGFDAGGRSFAMLSTERNVTITEVAPAQKSLVHVNTLLMLTESNGY